MHWNHRKALFENVMSNRRFRTASTARILGATMVAIICFVRQKTNALRSVEVVLGAARHRQTHLDARNRRAESESVPTILNPISKRRIHLGGPKYSELIGEGGWIQHRGTLERIDLKILSRIQEAEHSGEDACAPTSPTQKTYVKDEWYSVTPSIIRVPEHMAEKSPDVLRINSSSLKAVMDDLTAERLRQELLFVNKPSGLHCVPSRSLSDSLSVQVLSSYPSSKPCHRLDRDTSGIVCFGLTRDAHRDISMQFEARNTSKTYVALISGRPKEDSGTVNLPIGKQKTKEGFNRWTIGGEKPRESVTNWAIDKVFHDEKTGAIFTRVKLKPITGRGHQLRLHMKAIGCPILGDTIHESSSIAMSASRLCLHAQTLEIDWNGLRLEASSVPPF